MRLFGVRLFIFSVMADLAVSVNCQFDLIVYIDTEYAAVDLRGLRRNVASK